jgi:hypothetical protein
LAASRSAVLLPMLPVLPRTVTVFMPSARP